MDDENRVIDIIDNFGKLQEESSLEYYNGIMLPGFISNLINSGEKLLNYDSNNLIFNKLIHFQQVNPLINLSDILNFHTEKNLGYKYRGFEKGIKTGVNLIENANLKELKLSPVSRLRILI